MAGIPRSVTPQNLPLPLSTQIQPELCHCTQFQVLDPKPLLSHLHLSMCDPMAPIIPYEQPHKHPPPLTTAVWHGRPKIEQCWLGFGFLAPNTSLLLVFMDVQPHNPHCFTQAIPPTLQHLPPLLFGMTGPKLSCCGLVSGIWHPLLLCVCKYTSAVAIGAASGAPD